MGVKTGLVSTETFSTSFVISGGGTDQIKPERGDCYPDGWIEDSILIGRPITYTQI